MSDGGVWKCADNAGNDGRITSSGKTPSSVMQSKSKSAWPLLVFFVFFPSLANEQFLGVEVSREHLVAEDICISEH